MSEQFSGKPLLKVENLSVSFKREDGTPFHAVENLNFSIEQGQTLALVGESGSGKSVTASAIAGFLPPTQTFYPSGAIYFECKQILGAPESEFQKIRGRDIGYIFQEPMTALNPLQTIFQQIAEVFQIHESLKPDQVKQKVIQLLELVDLSEDFLKRFPHELSGGQRQRVLIAIALACSPKLLIADEPTTALDWVVQTEIMDLIAKLQKTHNMALLLISHDLNMVKKYANQVLIMNQGKCVEQGDTAQIMQSPQQPYTIKLLNSIPSGSPPVCQETQTILSVRDVCVTYPTKSFFTKKFTKKVVDNFSFDLKIGETIGLVGPSGCGKSSFVYAIMGLLDNRALVNGQVHFQGQDLLSQDLLKLSIKSWRPYRRLIQMVFQDPFGSLNPRLSIGQIISEGLKVHYKNLNCKQIDERVCDVLTQVEMAPESRFRYPHEFSGGQRQRIAIARALILEPNIIIFDEPTSALDKTVQKEILDLLLTLQKTKKMSYIFISHDLDVIRAMSHRVFILEGGKIIKQGKADEILPKIN